MLIIETDKVDGGFKYQMTTHEEYPAKHPERRLIEKTLIEGILDLNKVGIIALHDEPYPYIVPMNYGYEWQDELILYFHTGPGGLREELISRNPNVAVNIHCFLDRFGFQRVGNKDHDYRSVNVFGKAEILTMKNSPDEFLKGMNAILKRQRSIPGMKRMPEKYENTLRILKVTAKEITAKAQYPLHKIEDVPIPPNYKAERKIK